MGRDRRRSRRGLPGLAVPQGVQQRPLPRPHAAAPLDRDRALHTPAARRRRARDRSGHDPRDLMEAGTGSDLREQSTGELLKRLSQETSTLVRQELELARAELTEKGKQAGKGAGMFGGAGVSAVMALFALTLTVIFVLDTFMKGWLAALIVTLIWGAIAGVLALQGRNKIQEATPPAPQTVETVKEDVRWAKNRR